ncbi:MAG: helix-turn-helix transcriptional regulator [Muribaculaceae bacterium]|nr:helix-turn-helix transcriptional regulator [Muribaculaceae bacterium]
MKSRAVEFLEANQSGQTSTFEADAQWRAENASWLKRSRSVALAIIDFMQDHGLTLNDVAAMLNVSPQYVSRILSGKVNFSFKSVAEIEERLGVECFRAAAIV